MKKTLNAIIIGVAITVSSAGLMATGAFLWDHFRESAGIAEIRSDLDALYAAVNDVAQDQ